MCSIFNSFCELVIFYQKVIPGSCGVKTDFSLVIYAGHLQLFSLLKLPLLLLQSITHLITVEIVILLIF